VRVRDVIAELRTFAANVAYLCHDVFPNSFTNLQYIRKGASAPDERGYGVPRTSL
jgi:hypothetical protein